VNQGRTWSTVNLVVSTPPTLTNRSPTRNPASKPYPSNASTTVTPSPSAAAGVAATSSLLPPPGGASVGGVGGRSLGAAAPGRVLARALPLITSPTPP
jgi:hypothetical protein